jgi:hypothetical protein
MQLSASGYRPVEWSARGGEHSEPAGTASCSRHDVPAPDPVLVDDVIAAEDRPMLLGVENPRGPDIAVGLGAAAAR